jgi:hypothetical protein
MPQIIHNGLGIQSNGIGNNINNALPLHSNSQHNIPVGLPIGPHTTGPSPIMPHPNLGIPIGLQQNPYNVGHINQPNPFNTSHNNPVINPALAAAG